MDKDKQVQNIFRMAEMLNKSSNKKIEIQEVEETKVKEEVIVNTLPTTYLSNADLKLSTKDLVTTTSYLDRLKQKDERYTSLTYTEKQATKIRNSMLRFTTGTVSVAPILCKGDACPFKNTCLSGDTLILVKGNKLKKIKDILVGDLVYSFNTKTSRLELDKVTKTVIVGIKKVYKIKTEQGHTIKATEDHKFLSLDDNRNYVWRSLEEGLSINSPVISTDFDKYSEYIESLGDCFIDYIKSIKIQDEEEVYDITINKNSNFVANNIVVHNCDYFLQDVAPLGLACPIESDLIEYWMGKYMTEFNVDENSITDMHMISRLCTYDVYEMRLTKYLSQNDQTLLVDFISSYDEEGNAIANKATSAAFDTIAKIDNLRSKTLKELMATREAKNKVTQTMLQAKSTFDLSEIRSKFDEILKRKQAVSNPIKDIN